MPDLIHLPAWRVDFRYKIDPSVVRSNLPGRVRQSQRSHRQIMRASVTRTLRLSQLPYFEYFVRELCADGSAKFTDKYIDGEGVKTGLIRIVNGAYSVRTDGRTHTITCDIEVFR